jgi:hypothetical protein
MSSRPTSDVPVPPRDLGQCPRLAAVDVRAAEALVAAMSGWEASELATYKSAVLEELAAHGDKPVSGFLAVELTALQSLQPLGL